MGQGPGDDGGIPVKGPANSLKDGNEQAVPRTPDAASAQEGNAGFGAALRAIYRQTVDEAIPAEMLDLLKRLD